MKLFICIAALLVISCKMEAQRVKTIIFNSDTIKIYKPDKSIAGIRILNADTLTCFRLDDAQKDQLKKRTYSKFKNQNIEVLNKVMSAYLVLENSMDSLQTDKELSNHQLMKRTREALNAVDFYLGSDKPNGRNLADEYSFYVQRYNMKKSYLEKKEYIERALKANQ